MNKLEELRKQIDLIDKKMAELFEQRMQVVTEVIEYKKDKNLKTFDPKREENMKQRNCNYLKNEELKDYYLSFLDSCLDVSKKYQNSLKKDN